MMKQGLGHAQQCARIHVGDRTISPRKAA
jgi:hypothetical protein